MVYVVGDVSPWHGRIRSTYIDMEKISKNDDVIGQQLTSATDDLKLSLDIISIDDDYQKIHITS